MTYQLQDTRVPVEFVSRFREYAILVEPSALQQIEYCPWCGSKLPKELRDEWYQELEGLLGEQIYEIENLDDSVPKEFHDEKWWVKKGL
jgi:hypothetical protein